MTITYEPTKERIRKDKSAYQPPEVSQTARREYGRFRQWWETLEAKGAITAEQAMAAREFDTAWCIITDPKGVVGSYGERQWDGTPISQVDTSRLLGPEWREHCRSKITAARNLLEIEQWNALSNAVKTNGNLGHIALLLNIGGSASTQRARAGALIRQALHELSILWGFSRPFHPPTR
jgi:hypothetical protein